MFFIETGWPPLGLDEGLELRDVHVALERVRRVGIVGRPAGQVDRVAAPDLDVRPRRVEMDVVRDMVALPDERFEQDPLGGPPLVGGDDVGESEDIPDGGLEMEEVPAAGIGFVADHHAGPLVVAHGRRPGIREEVDEDLVRGDLEDV
jgi:hypothetical protein